MAATETSSSRDLTRSKFNEILQQAYIESTQDVPKTHKKVKKKAEKDMLESLRKGEAITKDEDKISLANTYDPDDDVKNTKSNKHRAKSRTGNVDVEKNVGSLNKGKKSRTKNLDDTAEDKVMVISELETSTRPKTSPKNKTPVKSKPVEKKVKKRPETSEHKDPQQVLSDWEKTKSLIESGEQVTSDKDDARERSDDTLDQTEPVKMRRKKKKKPVKEEAECTCDEVAAYEKALDGGDKTTDGAAAEKTQEVEPTEEASPKPVEDEGRTIGVTIHRTDKLKTDFYMAHPLVRVSVVDANTGQLVKKQTKGRAVTSFYESDHDKVDMILPIMTQPFDFKVNKSTLPVWEELLVLNENFNYITQDDPRVIIFFEVLDFVSMNAARRQIVTEDHGWHRIAWAFLKVVGANGKSNTDKKIRLQLYQPAVRFRAHGPQLEVFQWWSSATRIRYPSTLYVTLKSLLSPDSLTPAPRSMFATQKEQGRATYDDLYQTTDTARLAVAAKKGPWPWGRMPGQMCRVPNAALMSLPTGRRGCFVLRFSHDGRSLACGCADKEGYPIVIYEVPSGRLRGQFLGHYSLVYDLSWSRNDHYLVSASADGTARVWDVEKFTSSPHKLLPHPSFVYSASFHPRVYKVLVTGGYDGNLRIWTLQTDNSQAQLLQEMDGHIGHINTLCFDGEGAKLYTGDSLGQIRIWNCYVTDKPSSQGQLRDWSLNRSISEKDMKGIAINSIQLHPGGHRLLVHCRDNSIRLLDLRVNSTMLQYVGAVNFREHIRSCVTPCGTFVFAGSEDSCAYVWNTETGDQVAMYSELNFKSPVCDVRFHPHDNLVAFCSFGDSQPVRLYHYDHKVAQKAVGVDRVETMRQSGQMLSPEMLTAREKTEDESLEASRSKVKSVTDSFHAEEVNRMDRVRKKLEAVSAFSGSHHPLGIPADTTTNYLSTWGSTFDSTALRSRPTSPGLGTMSPHRLTASSLQQQQQQLSAHTDYLRQSGGTWRPEFTSVGRDSGLRRSAGYSRGPQVALSMTDGKAQFSYQGSPTKPTAKDMVVALYDYQAQRSDELSLVRGQTLTVLYKDNVNWWMGEVEGGQQGFFPANYVASYLSQEAEGLDAEKERSLDKETDDLDAETDQRLGTETEEEVDVKKSVVAVVNKSGDLKFFSATEDSDAETPVHRTKKKGKKSSEAVNDSEKPVMRKKRTMRAKDLPV